MAFGSMEKQYVEEVFQQVNSSTRTVVGSTSQFSTLHEYTVPKDGLYSVETSCLMYGGGSGNGYAYETKLMRGNTNLFTTSNIQIPSTYMEGNHGMLFRLQKNDVVRIQGRFTGSTSGTCTYTRVRLTKILD